MLSYNQSAHTDSTLPIAVQVCTNVVDFNSVDVATYDVSAADLNECFTNILRGDSGLRPLPSSSKDTKKALARFGAFHSSQLTSFLRGYMYLSKPIPDDVLDSIRTLCVFSDSEWVYRCQSIALELLTRELMAKSMNMIPRANPEDPLLLPKLRNVLPTMKEPPKVSVNNCHFMFVGKFGQSGSDGTVTEDLLSGVVRVRNDGTSSFSIELAQTLTIIDGVRADSSIAATVEPVFERQVVNRGESVEMTLSMRGTPRSGFSEYQQIHVLSVDGVVKIFATFTVVSLRQRLFSRRFPSCLPLRVQHSPLGSYSAPLILQLLKHQLVRQQGLSNVAVVRLMVSKATNFGVHNRELMREAAAVVDTLTNSTSTAEVLDTYWAASAAGRPATPEQRHKLPTSSAQPAGYLPGADFPAARGHTSTSSAMGVFPSVVTYVPDALTKAPPAVTMGVILTWLAQLDASVFDASLNSCDSVSYFETMPPHLKGIVLWTLDLSCALLANRASNGATERDLAMTFASVLCRRGIVGSDWTAASFAAAPQSTFAMEVRHLQVAVNAYLYWIMVCNSKYSKEVRK